MQTEKESFQNMTVGKKLEHIWEYYKLPLLGIALVLFIIIYTIVRLATPEPEVLMRAVLVNASPMLAEEEDTFARYLTEQGYNREEAAISVNASLYFDREHMSESNAVSYQALAAMVMLGEIDLLTGDADTFELLGVENGLMAMEDVLPEELLEKYQDRLYTVTEGETGRQLVCGIWLPDVNGLTRDGYYVTKVLAGIPITAVNTDMAKEVLMYLLEG